MGHKCTDERSIHVVVGFNGETIILISAYYPDLNHWLDDFKTRR